MVGTVPLEVADTVTLRASELLVDHYTDGATGLATDRVSIGLSPHGMNLTRIVTHMAPGGLGTIGPTRDLSGVGT